MNEQKQVKGGDDGPYAFRCAIGNPRVIFRCSFEHGVDYFPVEFSAEDWPLKRADIDVPEEFIMKYLPEGSDFKSHVNLIITELPKKLLGYAGLPGKVRTRI